MSRIDIKKERKRTKKNAMMRNNNFFRFMVILFLATTRTPSSLLSKKTTQGRHKHFVYVLESREQEAREQGFCYSQGLSVSLLSVRIKY
jgi:hypothetical protein